MSLCQVYNALHYVSYAGFAVLGYCVRCIMPCTMCAEGTPVWSRQGEERRILPVYKSKYNTQSCQCYHPASSGHQYTVMMRTDLVSDMVHGCMVYTERAKMAAVSCGTSHVSVVSTPLHWIFKNAL